MYCFSLQIQWQDDQMGRRWPEEFGLWKVINSHIIPRTFKAIEILYEYYIIIFQNFRYALKFGPVSSKDSGTYLCLLNNRREPDAPIVLTVQGQTNISYSTTTVVIKKFDTEKNYTFPPTSKFSTKDTMVASTV